MSTMEQVLDNLSTFEDFKPLSVAKKGLIKGNRRRNQGEDDERLYRLCVLYAVSIGLDIPKEFPHLE